MRNILVWFQICTKVKAIHECNEMHTIRSNFNAYQQNMYSFFIMAIIIAFRVLLLQLRKYCYSMQHVFYRRYGLTLQLYENEN